MATASAGDARRTVIIDDGAVACCDGRIAWAGPSADVPGKATKNFALDGRLVTPGLIDCHTHIVFAGNRAPEMQMRLEGASYEAIAAAGGGIVSTVRNTRAAGEEELFSAAAGRLERLIAEGVTTVEIKSGYGLDLANELKMLAVARRLGRELPVRISTSLLAAHVIPPEHKGDRRAYVDAICDEIIPASVGLADAVDGFCETIAFSADETARIFAAATRHALPVRLHADQLNDSGGAALAARFNALSADHLEWANEAGIAAMARAGTVAVMLPGASHMLRDDRCPPIDRFRAHAVPMAIATDCNPGTSPLTSLLLAMNFAVIDYDLTIDEALAGVTRHAAQALGLAADIGTIEPGKYCDLAIWDAVEPAELIYWTGRSLLHQRIFEGQPI